MKLDAIKKAQHRLQPYLFPSPVMLSWELGEKLGLRGPLALKCENFQVTRSFKIRGALNVALSAKGGHLVARSSGNFAQAVAGVAQWLGIPATLVMPTTAPRIKVERSRARGAEVILHGTTHAEGHAKAMELLEQIDDGRFLPAYDHFDVIAGNSTLVLELMQQLEGAPPPGHFYAPIGGGGLMAGCSTAIKLLAPKCTVVAVEPEGANDFQLSHKAGKRIARSDVDTIADGLRAPIVGERPWTLLERHVDDAVAVNDADIRRAMRFLYEECGMLVEPSGATALAALLAHPAPQDQGTTVCVVSGGNVEQEPFLPL